MMRVIGLIVTCVETLRLLNPNAFQDQVVLLGTQLDWKPGQLS
ncbi:hypothetical protein Taro_002347 [Colocasia esculenta]|uniref:Uncharacterized protein n=1 Tax=Colocasia esculenta TaxID=4460 RepID=A0A843TIV2_COLES|nr:hypothetical protein [Colocasia esculenta]